VTDEVEKTSMEKDYQRFNNKNIIQQDKCWVHEKQFMVSK